MFICYYSVKTGSVYHLRASDNVLLKMGADNKWYREPRSIDIKAGIHTGFFREIKIEGNECSVYQVSIGAGFISGGHYHLKTSTPSVGIMQSISRKRYRIGNAVIPTMGG